MPNFRHARGWRFGGSLAVVATASLVLSFAATRGTAQTTDSYTYDARGRLVTKVTNGFQFSSTSYRFDSADNRSNVSVATSESILYNRSFEFPAVSGYQYSPPSSEAQGISFVAGAGVTISGGAWGFPAPWHGNQVAFLQSGSGGGGYIDMPINGLTIGARYRLAFATAQRPGYPANSFIVSTGSQTIWAGVPASAAQFTPYATDSFTASAASMVVRFAATPTSDDRASAIDAVSVEKQ